MKIFSVIRAQEWWSHKLPPLLAIGYGTALMSPVSIYKISLWLVFLLASLVVGAIYVSVINDITDLDEDLASGKSNRIQQVPENLRWIIPCLCLVIGFLFGFFIYPDVLSCALYLSSWIVFSLYSIRPIRLKNRGILGVFADGFGSHVFTSLLMVASTSYVTNQNINWTWFGAVGLWALCYGLRGILWHQFTDRDNDIKVNLNTYASKKDPKKFKNISILITVIELTSLVVILYELSLISTIVALILYLALMLMRFLAYKNQVVLIIKQNDKPFQIFMADYYQMFLPLSLLISAAITTPLNIIILLAHIILFPDIVQRAFFDYFYISKTIWRHFKFQK